MLDIIFFTSRGILKTFRTRANKFVLNVRFIYIYLFLHYV